VSCGRRIRPRALPFHSVDTYAEGRGLMLTYCKRRYSNGEYGLHVDWPDQDVWAAVRSARRQMRLPPLEDDVDPNACLKEMLELAEDLADSEGVLDQGREANIQRLCELVQAMDGWLRKSGHLPERWSKK
jgi:hypothetical protein